MIIRFFIKAADKAEAEKVVDESFHAIRESIKKKEYQNIEAYWKMQGVYLVEVLLELQQDVLRPFMEDISDAWIELGDPLEELLASKDNEQCTFMRDKFVMVNIVLRA